MSDTLPTDSSADTPAAPRRRRIDPVFVSIQNWCDVSGMGRSATYGALARGDLLAVKRGTRTLIDVKHGLKWMRGLPRATIGGRKQAA